MKKIDEELFEERKKEIIEEIKKLSEIKGSTITLSEFTHSQTYIKKYFITWSKAVEAAGLSKNINHYTKEDMVKIVQDYFKINNKTPSSKNITFSQNLLIEYFGTWNNLIKESGLSVNNEVVEVLKTDEELIEFYKELSIKLGKNVYGADVEDLKENGYSADIFGLRFGGISELREKAGFSAKHKITTKYTKKEIEVILLKTHKKYGKIKQSDIKTMTGLNVTTILRYFNTTKMSDVWDEIERKVK